MNRSNLSKVVGASVLGLSLAITPLALPVTAQTNTESNQRTFDTTPLQETKSDFNNFGWLGLLGLIGLAKLFSKRREPEPRQAHNEVNSSGYHDPNAVHPSSYADPNAVGGSYTDPNAVDRSSYTDSGSANPSSYSDPNVTDRPGYTNPSDPANPRDYPR